MGRPVDLSLLRNGTWERASYTVPLDTPEDKVKYSASKYMTRFGDNLEAQGFKVLIMSKPEIDKSRIPTDPDRKRYVLWAWVRRNPATFKIDVPDIAVPSMLEKGMKLK